MKTDVVNASAKYQRSSAQGQPRFDIIPAVDVDHELRGAWDSLRRDCQTFRSPFFSHEFVTAVAQFVPHVEIGIASRNGKVVALFPFQRFQRQIARPVGMGINDAHGMLALPDETVSLHQLMAACGVSSFPFHAAPRTCSEIATYEVGTTRSFLADLTVDPLGYEHHLRESSRTIEKQSQKTRRLIRELGPLRFEFDCRDPRLLQYLIELKCNQYRRTHIFNILGVPWIQQLLNKLHQAVDQPMRGILNVLFAGDVPVALHFGMIEHDLLHYWFPVFAPQAAFGSPGTQLFLEVAKESAVRGLSAIDMGYGEQDYKVKLTNVISEMSYGIVDRNPLRRHWYRQKRALREQMSRLRFKEAIKPWARRLLPGFGRGTYQA